MEIIESLSKLQKQDSAVTIGFFDGVHLGHLAVIEKLKAEASARSLRSVVVTFAIHPRESMKASYVPKLLTTKHDRLQKLSETGIDTCVILDFNAEMISMSSAGFMRKYLSDKIGAKYLLVGHDHHFGADREHGYTYYKEVGETLGIEVEQAPKFEIDGNVISSSFIRKKIEQADIENLDKYLGYNYYIEGLIVHGHKIGKSLGFPTANVAINDVRKQIPFEGVYAANVYVDNSSTPLKAMLNIGIRPTFVTGSNSKTIEVHIFDFDEDIYGKSLKVELLKYFRSELKFDNQAKLIEQLGKDRDSVCQWFGLK